jgi:hypothetical protein
MTQSGFFNFNIFGKQVLRLSVTIHNNRNLA